MRFHRGYAQTGHPNKSAGLVLEHCQDPARPERELINGVDDKGFVPPSE